MVRGQGSEPHEHPVHGTPRGVRSDRSSCTRLGESVVYHVAVLAGAAGMPNS